MSLRLGSRGPTRLRSRGTAKMKARRQKSLGTKRTEAGGTFQVLMRMLLVQRATGKPMQR